MKFLKFLFLLFLAIPVYGQAPTGQRAFTFSSATSDVGIPLAGTGVQYHQLVWTVTGPPASCTIALDSSTNGSSWTAGGVISGQTCTSNGASVVTAANVNFIRITVTVLGSGTVTGTWLGGITNTFGNTTVAGTSTQPIAPITPSSVSITQTGTAGTTARTYWVLTSNGSTYGIPNPYTTLTGNATLNSSNFNVITATVTGATTCTFYAATSLRAATFNIGTSSVTSGSCTLNDQGQAGTKQDPFIFVTGGFVSNYLNGGIILDGCLAWVSSPRYLCNGAGLRQAQLDARTGQFGGKVFIPETGECGSRDQTLATNGCVAGGVNMGCQGITMAPFDVIQGAGRDVTALDFQGQTSQPTVSSVVVAADTITTTVTVNSSSCNHVGQYIPFTGFTGTATWLNTSGSTRPYLYVTSIPNTTTIVGQLTGGASSNSPASPFTHAAGTYTDSGSENVPNSAIDFPIATSGVNRVCEVRDLAIALDQNVAGVGISFEGQANYATQEHWVHDVNIESNVNVNSTQSGITLTPAPTGANGSTNITVDKFDNIIFTKIGKPIISSGDYNNTFTGMDIETPLGSDNALNLQSSNDRFVVGIHGLSTSTNGILVASGNNANNMFIYQCDLQVSVGSCVTDSSNGGNIFEIQNNNGTPIGTFSNGDYVEDSEFTPAASGQTVAKTVYNAVPILASAATIQGAFGTFGSNMILSQAACETSFGITTLSGASTNTGQNCLPANAIILGVSYRITTTITTAVSFTIGDAGSATRYCNTQSTLTAGTTGTCTAAGYFLNTSAAPVKITPSTTPGAGAMRLVVQYLTWTAPTS